MPSVARGAISVLLAAVLLFSFISTSGEVSIAAASPSPLPSGSVRHVITIVMENEGYSQVIGNPDAPYENALASNFTLLTSYFAVSHPSLPNYLAMVSGNSYVSSDCIPSQCSLNSSSVADLLQGSGLSWKEYAESIPANCSQVSSQDGLYQPKHDPFVYFESITGNNGTGVTSAYCDSHVVSFGQLWNDMSANALPNYSFVTPNMCDDGHDCPLSAADMWLSTVVPRIESSPEFSSTVLFIVYDEGSGSGGFGVAHGGQVPCIVVSPLVYRGYRSATQYSHYSVLATAESLLGVGSLGRNDSTSPVMNDVFSASSVQTTGTVTGSYQTSDFTKSSGSTKSSGTSTLLQSSASSASSTAIGTSNSSASTGGIEPIGPNLIFVFAAGLVITTVVLLTLIGAGRKAGKEPSLHG